MVVANATLRRDRLKLEPILDLLGRKRRPKLRHRDFDPISNLLGIISMKFVSADLFSLLSQMHYLLVQPLKRPRHVTCIGHCISFRKLACDVVFGVVPLVD